MPKSKKFINDPKLIPQEVTAGFLSANSDLIHRVGVGNVIAVNDLAEGKVGVLIGGGMTSEPLFVGYVGKNMADCAALGNINAAPSPYYILEGIRAINRGKGVLLVYNNYSGDILSFDMAAELAEEEGIQTKTVRVWDDVGSAPHEKNIERRGLAGIILVTKVAGGAASEIDNLEEVCRIAALARDNTHTLIAAARSGSYLENGELMFNLPEDEMEIGVGLHGETGIIRCKMMSANETVDLILEKLISDSHCKSGDEIAILLNSMGATSFTELFLLNNRIKDVLTDKAINNHHTDIGFFYNSQDMVGFSISLMMLNDELKRYFDLPVNSFSYKR